MHLAIAFRTTVGQWSTYRDRIALKHETASHAHLRQDNAQEKKYHRVNKRHAQECGATGAFPPPERSQFHNEPAGGNGGILLLLHKTRG